MVAIPILKYLNSLPVFLINVCCYLPFIKKSLEQKSTGFTFANNKFSAYQLIHEEKAGHTKFVEALFVDCNIAYHLYTFKQWHQFIDP